MDKFDHPVDLVVLDTKPVAEGANYVPIILWRPFLATSNAIINCRNGVMQLTFGNMTLELSIFHLRKKHMHLVEEDPEEVCLIDTIQDEQSQLQQLLEDLIEKPGEILRSYRKPQIYVPFMGLEEEKKKSFPY